MDTNEGAWVSKAKRRLINALGSWERELDFHWMGGFVEQDTADSINHECRQLRLIRAILTNDAEPTSAEMTLNRIKAILVKAISTEEARTQLEWQYLDEICNVICEETRPSDEP